MARDQKRRRRLSINEDFDGMWSINGELDPETGALVNKAIDHLSRPGYLDGDDRRAPWRVRADALGAICEQSLRHNNTTTSKGTKPHITVTIDADALLRLRTGLGTIDETPVARLVNHAHSHQQRGHTNRHRASNKGRTCRDAPCPGRTGPWLSMERM